LGEYDGLSVSGSKEFVMRIDPRRLRICASLLSAGVLYFATPRSVCATDRTSGRQSHPSPEVRTRSASPLGSTAMTVNGSIHPHGATVTYFFEFGSSPGYGSATQRKTLPSRLGAYYRETWDEGLGAWGSWLTASHHAAGGQSKGFVRFSQPSGIDYNHGDGIGIVQLAQYLFTGFTDPDPGADVPQSVFLGGGDPDLRDARISVAVRGNNWRANGSELVFWAQSQSNPEVRHNPGFRRSNWVYTQFNLTDYLLDGNWHRVQYRLWNDASQWTYGGNNPTRQGESAIRYSYWPLDESLAHVNVDFFHLMAFVDVKNAPTGSIDFDEFELNYRNKSLLFPGNGARLVNGPRNSNDDPATITDGWRHGAERMWRSGENPDSAQAFIFECESVITVESVQVHQNPDWPGKEVELLVSSDGASYRLLWQGVLPETGRPNANLAFLFQTGLSAKARFVKVRLLSGYREKHWGLGEVELFGTGATLMPENDTNYVNADIGDLTPGKTYYYRLVAESGSGKTYGERQSLTLPVDSKPQTTTGPATRVTASGAKLEGRLCPMGIPTHYVFEYGTSRRYGSKTQQAYGGLMETPRTVFAGVSGLKPGTTYHYRLVATNSQGVSRGRDATVRTLVGNPDRKGTTSKVALGN
jgi:hypothetical protein